MHRLVSVLAVLRAAKRNLAGFRAVRANSFFWFIALLLYSATESGTEPASAEPFLLLAVFLMLLTAGAGIWRLADRHPDPTPSRYLGGLYRDCAVP